MKLVPHLPPLNPPAQTMERLLNTSDLLWRYHPFNYSPVHSYTPPDFKTHLPANLGGDPRQWSREDVISFLRWAQYEFDLPAFDFEMFQMNGKALCLLTKADLNERSPGNGDVLHNVLQMLVRDYRTLPSSPLTPQFPLATAWTLQNAPAIEYPSTPPAVSQLNSVTLSPAPSIDSQAGSPRPYPVLTNYGSSTLCGGGSGGSSGSNQSDSEVDEGPRPPPTPTLTPRTPPPHSPASANSKTATTFFPSDPVSEPNTNGRLLWDFLQQLLNDCHHRYTSYIAWKNRELGVFKIVDPPGLAKLWGIQKNHLSMNYDKMSRALRYYYRVNILRKVQGERHCYQFLRNPSELKSIKNISLLRQQMTANSESQQNLFFKAEPADPVEDDLPTDLSMGPQCRLTADFEYLRNPSEVKIMKNLHTLREQKVNSAAQSSAEIVTQIPVVSESSQTHIQVLPRDFSLNLSSDLRRPRDLSESRVRPRDLSAMQLSLNLATEPPQDLSVSPRPHSSPPMTAFPYSVTLLKTEDCDRS